MDGPAQLDRPKDAGENSVFRTNGPSAGPIFNMQADIGFSEQAADKVRQLIVSEGNDGLKLRVFVAGGGCSG